MSVGPPLRPSAIGTSSIVEVLQAAGKQRGRQGRDARAGKKPSAFTICHIFARRSGNRTHWTSHDNMSRKRLTRREERFDHVQSSRVGQDRRRRSAGRRAVSRQGPRTLRAEPRPHDRAGRQGSLRLGGAARERRGPRLRRRADGRHGQDLLEGHRILAVRSGARARGADAAVLRLPDRLGQRDQPAPGPARSRRRPSRPTAATSASRTPNGARTPSSIS